MPRTKYTRKPRDDRSSVDYDLLVRDFEQQADLRISKMEAETKLAIRSLEKSVDFILSGLPTEVLQMTLAEIMNMSQDDQKENEASSSADEFSPPVSTAIKKKTKRITSTSDDGYITESVSASRASRARTTETAKRRTRSSSRNSKQSHAEVIQPSVRKVGRPRKESVRVDKFKTPAVPKPSGKDYGLITPKVKPNTPLNILRRPRQGETVISMQGSPLLVSAVVQEDIANINIPLRDGNVMSLLPNGGLRMSCIPALDPETMKQLETLKNHIEKVVGCK